MLAFWFRQVSISTLGPCVQSPELNVPEETFWDIILIR